MKPDSIMRTDVRFVAAGISLGDPVSEPVSAVSGGRRQAKAAAVLRCNQLAAAIDAVRARMRRRRRSSIHACTPGAVHGGRNGGLARMPASRSGSLARARVRALHASSRGDDSPEKDRFSGFHHPVSCAAGTVQNRPMPALAYPYLL
jgi:hypothetical protein